MSLGRYWPGITGYRTMGDIGSIRNRIVARWLLDKPQLNGCMFSNFAPPVCEPAIPFLHVTSQSTLSGPGQPSSTCTYKLMAASLAVHFQAIERGYQAIIVALTTNIPPIAIDRSCYCDPGVVWLYVQQLTFRPAKPAQRIWPKQYCSPAYLAAPGYRPCEP